MTNHTPIERPYRVVTNLENICFDYLQKSKKLFKKTRFQRRVFGLEIPKRFR